jgi:hypothetical protein
MKLQKAVEEALRKHDAKHHPLGVSAIILEQIERWLRHNGYHTAADALEIEHMP